MYNFALMTDTLNEGGARILFVLISSLNSVDGVVLNSDHKMIVSEVKDKPLYLDKKSTDDETRNPLVRDKAMKDIDVTVLSLWCDFPLLHPN